MLPVAEAVESGAIGLTLSIVLTYCYSRRKGAEALDAELSIHLDKADAEISEKALCISALKESLRKKHPHDIKKEDDIRKAFAVIDDRQIRAFAWLLDAGEASRGVLQHVHGLDADYFHGRADFPPLLLFKSFRPGNGTTELDRTYYINGSMAEALRNVLHPPEAIDPK